LTASTTTLSAPSIRPLLAADVVAYQALRLRALSEHPAAFTSSAEEEAARPLSWSEQRLKPDAQRPHDIFLGAWQSNLLLGIVGLQGRYRIKERHNATLVGLYVAPQGSGHGLGLALVQALLAHARSLPELQQLDLTVTAGNPMAQALYERCGFSVWGVMPRAVKVDGRLFAKVHMVCPLR
jgi:RimJ/RimL family protein N-acetyltransferase